MTLVALAIALVAGCDRNRAVQKISIVFVSPGLSNPFFVDMTNAAKSEAAKDSHVTFSIKSPAVFADVQQQVEYLEIAVAQRVSVICLVTADSKGVIPVLKKAQDAGVQVVLIDNTIDSAAAASAGLRIPTRIGSDNALGGRLAGEYLATVLGNSGEVAILEGIPSDVANARKSGFLAGLAGHSNLRVVASQTANYSRAEALNVVKAVLVAHPRLRGILAANDEMALGAVTAIAEAGKRPAPRVVGFDATADAVKAVAAGQMAATVQQQPEEMGRVAVRTAIALAKGAVVTPRVMVPVRLLDQKALNGSR